MSTIKKKIRKAVTNPEKVPKYIKHRTFSQLPELLLVIRWKGGWKHLLNRYDVLNEPYQIALRSKSPPFYINWKDKDVIWEFYQTDGYEDLDLSKFDTIVDIGAHIGLFSIEASKSGAKVYAFEPSTESYANLIFNIQLHSESDSDIIPHNLAVSSSCGYCDFLKDENLSLSDSTVVGNEEKDVIEVPCITFTKLVENIDLSGRTLLKMDCEGAEFEILESSTKEDFARIDTVFLEYHGEVGEPEQLNAMLEEYGYSVCQREDPRDLDSYDLGFMLANKSG